MQPLYTTLKVNNEIELCEVSDPDCKQLIERGSFKKSDFLLYPLAEVLFFNRKKDSCIICINDNVRDTAEEIVRGICDESGYNVRFILKRSSNTYL